MSGTVGRLSSTSVAVILAPTIVTLDVTAASSAAMRATKLCPSSIKRDLSVPMRRDCPPLRMKPSIESMKRILVCRGLNQETSGRAVTPHYQSLLLGEHSEATLLSTGIGSFNVRNNYFTATRL